MEFETFRLLLINIFQLIQRIFIIRYLEHKKII